MQAEPATPAAGSSSQAGRPKTPDAKASSSNSSSLGQCFGMGKTLDDADQEERPLGVVGLRNLGEPSFLTRPLHVAGLCSLADLSVNTPTALCTLTVTPFCLILLSPPSMLT